MKNLAALLFLFTTVLFFNQCTTGSNASDEIVSFYDVPLICGAAPEIGCGSRIKPLFIDAEKETSIKESWTNREGTVIAVVWSQNEDEELIQSLFEKNGIEATLIGNEEELKTVSSDFRQDKKWLRGMDVDQLSIEEAGVIADNLTQVAVEENLITKDESTKIKKDLEEYFKKELVIVRTEEELRSEELQERWMEDGHEIYQKYLGQERADAVSSFFATHQELMIENGTCCGTKEGEMDDCCKKKKAA